MAQVGALPASVDLVLYAGDDFWMNVMVTDVNGDPIDISGYTPASQIRATPGRTTNVLAEFDIESVDANTLKLTLPGDDTATLPWLSAWDLQLTDAGGVVMTLVYGEVRTTGEVTR